MSHEATRIENSLSFSHSGLSKTQTNWRLYASQTQYMSTLRVQIKQEIKDNMFDHYSYLKYITRYCTITTFYIKLSKPAYYTCIHKTIKDIYIYVYCLRTIMWIYWNIICIQFVTVGSPLKQCVLALKSNVNMIIPTNEGKKEHTY